jgi:hypothetical protein
MIGTSVVRVHQRGASPRTEASLLVDLVDGLTSKIPILVDSNGLPVQLGLTGGQTHDNWLCEVLLATLPS